MEATIVGFAVAGSAASAKSAADRSKAGPKKAKATTTTKARRSRRVVVKACLGGGSGDSLDGKGREGENDVEFSLAAERLEAALAAAAENERRQEREEQQRQQLRRTSSRREDVHGDADGGGAIERLGAIRDGIELQFPAGIRLSDGVDGNGVAMAINGRTRNIWEEVEEAEVLLRGLEAQLEAAVKREDYSEASRLKMTVDAVKRKDTVKAVVEQLESALRDERYEEATLLRDDGAVGLLGWWVAYKSIDGQRLPHGHIIKIEPRFARYVAKCYTARDLYEGKDGKDVIEAYLIDKERDRYQTEVFLLREKAKSSNLLDSSSTGSGIMISGMDNDDGLDDDDLTDVEVENVDFIQHDEHNFELKIQVTSYEDDKDDDDKDESEDKKNKDDKSNEPSNNNNDWTASATKRVLELTGLRPQGKQASNSSSSMDDESEEDSEDKDKDNTEAEMGLLGVERRDGEDDVSHQSRKQERARQIAQLLATGSLKFPGGSNDLSQLQFDSHSVVAPETEGEVDRQRVRAYLYQRGKHTFAFETSGESSTLGGQDTDDSRESGHPPADGDDYSLTLVSAASKAIDFAEEARGAESQKAKTDAIAKAVHLLRQAAQKQLPHGFPSSAIFRRLHVGANRGLEGVFAGSFGLHGPECVQLIRAPASSVYSDADKAEEDVWDKDELCISALKLTGDPNVPAGEMTFRAKIGAGRKLDHRGEYPEELGVKARYKGQGRVAQLGFKQPQWVDGELLVFDQCRSVVTGGAELGFVWCIPGERRFLVLFNRLNLDKI